MGLGRERRALQSNLGRAGESGSVSPFCCRRTPGTQARAHARLLVHASVRSHCILRTSRHAHISDLGRGALSTRILNRIQIWEQENHGELVKMRFPGPLFSLLVASLWDAFRSGTRRICCRRPVDTTSRGSALKARKSP